MLHFLFIYRLPFLHSRNSLQLHFAVQLSQLMILWYLSHRRPSEAQASLRIRGVSPEPSLFANMKYGSRWRVRPKISHLAHWIAAHARLNNGFTEDEKCHNLMSWLNYRFSIFMIGIVVVMIFGSKMFHCFCCFPLSDNKDIL